MSTDTGAAQAGAKDAYAVCQQSADRIMDAVKQSLPRYHQSVTNAQQECVDACENVISSSISLQREFARRAGATTNVPEAALRAMRDATDGAVRAASVGSQVAIAAIDAARQNASAFNDNAKALAELSQTILRSWMSAFSAGRA